MATHATWWDEPKAGRGGDSPVIRHAPNDDRYNYVDREQLARIGGSPVGNYATIPEANQNGTSRGFDHSTAGVVHVDPAAPDGGVIVDLGQVRGQDVNDAVATSKYPHQAYYKLSKKYGIETPCELEDEPAPTNSRAPGVYVTPRTGQQIVPLNSENGMAPRQRPLGPPPELAVPIPRQPVYQEPGYPPYQQCVPQLQYGAPPFPPQYHQQSFQQPGYQPVDPQLQQTLRTLAQGMQTLSGEVAAINSRNSDAPSPRVRSKLATVPDEEAEANGYPHGDPYRRRVRGELPAEESGEHEAPPRRSAQLREHRQTLREYQREQEEEQAPIDHLIVGFEALKIPFVDGPLGKKARTQVFFEYPGTGKAAARFHAVIDDKHCVVLVYDQRYEDGTQYIPDEREDQAISITIPSLKKSYSVASVGVTFSLGVFDFVVLVKKDGEVADHDDD